MAYHKSIYKLVHKSSEYFVYIYIYICVCVCVCVCVLGACDVMVIVIGNRHGDPRSNHGWGC